MAKLNVIQPAAKPRPSSMGRIRAMVLIGVHLAIAIHIWHWKATGTTVTPVEPSEAMQTLELGYVNAGFVFFALAILSTLILGRWFCGWGCHLVAIQDFCSWILKKIGIRPKPFRSRLLVWIPVFAAFYMFAYPSLSRILAGNGHPAWQAHFQTESFWATFPNWQIATITFLICGFLSVIWLGNKGFCTYACPYGGIFYHADRLAPGRIRVTDDCDQCGHCTTACTSNIRVHEQVALLKMVQDPGCMKCMDCVSVCPKNALYFGFGSPLPEKVEKAPSRTYDVSLQEEAFLFFLFAVCFYSFRGLYEAVPFLLSVGLASICSFLLLTLVRLFYKRELRLQRFQLKRNGKFLRAGAVFLALGIALCTLLGHSFYLNFHTHAANAALVKATDLSAASPESPEAIAAAQFAEKEFEIIDGGGLFPISEWKYKRGVVAQFLGKFDAARGFFQQALALESGRPNTRLQLAHLWFVAGNFESAASEYSLAVAGKASLGNLWSEYAESLLQIKKFEPAIGAFQKAVEADPDRTSNLMNLGMLLAQSGKVEQGETFLKAFVKKEYTSGQGFLNLGLIQATLGKSKEAIHALSQAIILEPHNGSALISRARLYAADQQNELAYHDSIAAVKSEPFSVAVITDFAAVIQALHMEDRAILEVSRLEKSVPQLSYPLAALYALKEDQVNLDKKLQKSREQNSNLPGF